MEVPRNGLSTTSMEVSVQSMTLTSADMLAGSLGYGEDERDKLLSDVLEAADRLPLEEQLKLSSHIGSAAVVLSNNAISQESYAATRPTPVSGAMELGPVSSRPFLTEETLDVLFGHYRLARPVKTTSTNGNTVTVDRGDGPALRSFDKSHYPEFRSAPANMRNFIASVMPNKATEECLELGPLAACLVTEMLIDRVLYTRIPGSRYNTAQRERRVKYIKDYTGLNGTPMSTTEVQERYQVTHVYAELAKSKAFLRLLGEKELLEILDNGLAHQLMLIRRKAD